MTEDLMRDVHAAKAPSTFMSLEELMAESGFGPQQVRRLIRLSAFPGQVHQGRVIVPRQLWEAYLRGEWIPKPQPTPEERRAAREARKAARAAASSAARNAIKQQKTQASGSFIRSHKPEPTG